MNLSQYPALARRHTPGQRRPPFASDRAQRGAVPSDLLPPDQRPDGPLPDPTPGFIDVLEREMSGSVGSATASSKA